MGDTDLSFEALKRFDDLDARVSALEQAAGIDEATPKETTDGTTDDTSSDSESVPEGYELIEEEPTDPTTTGSRSRKRS
jgi:hypothetical protein